LERTKAVLVLHELGALMLPKNFKNSYSKFFISLRH